ncbi:unnamed protein product [Rhizoctonia solani]|uniref:Uncharacterized protein n=1 Tax=Rhizoctonia solani TaxID=456999 RepID=A0A8H3BZ92_9AGAM|nr:unnamed protein product [Rhizoctonia solani]
MEDFEPYINPLGDAQARSQYFRSVTNQPLRASRPTITVAPPGFHADPEDDVPNLDRILGERDSESSELEAENNDEDELESIRQATLVASKIRKPPAPDGTRKGQTYRDAIERSGLAQDPEKMREWLDAAIKLLGETHEKASPTAERRRQQVGILWHEYLRITMPRTDPVRFWHQDVVETHCLLFLTHLVLHTKGRHNEMVRSTTLATWACDLVTLIGRFCVDRSSGNRTGSTVLSKGLFQKIQTHVNYITHESKLNRFPAPKGYIGRPELCHLYQTIFQHTEVLRRASFLQMAVATNIAFHTGCRVGSLGWSEKEYKERGMYMKP